MPIPKQRNKFGNIPVVLCTCRGVYEFYVPGEYTVNPKTGKKQKKKVACCPYCQSFPAIGKRFSGKLECKVFQDLCQEYGASNVIRQVSLPVSGNERMIIDFMVIGSDLGKTEVTQNGRTSIFIKALFIDAKGHATKAWLKKAKRLKEEHGIEIQLRRK